MTAFGLPPACAPGGATSHRGKGGERKGHAPRGKARDGQAVSCKAYRPPELSNPGNVIRSRVGGGQLGHALAHEGEAPMPMAVAERFVCWFAPPGGVVCDPFIGSGTTCQAAHEHGRRFIGCDLRQSQVDLTAKRMTTVTLSMFNTLEGAA